MKDPTVKDWTGRAIYICEKVGRSLPAGPVLDLGCSQGNLGMRIFVRNNLVRPEDVTGVDLEIRQKYQKLGCNMLVRNLEDDWAHDLPQKEYVGLIATEILEHISQEAEDRIVKFINKKVKSYFIITYPEVVKMRGGHIRQPDYMRLIKRLKFVGMFSGRTPTGSVLLIGSKW